MDEPRCIMYGASDMGFYRTCALYSKGTVGYVGFDQDTSYDGVMFGFKYCNVASPDPKDHVQVLLKFDNPFHDKIGIHCDQIVPKHCRRLPVQSMQALPTNLDGQCVRNPKTSDLDRSFCENHNVVILNRKAFQACFKKIDSVKLTSNHHFRQATQPLKYACTV